MDGAGLSKLGTALSVIFSVLLVVLFAELYYFLWRRRVFHGKTNTGGGVVAGDPLTHYSSSATALPSSKQLLYFFCLRRNSLLDRSSVTITPTNHLHSKRQTDMEAIDMDMFRFQSTFGPPRFLFTIKEEEAEDLDSPAEQKEVKKIDQNNKVRVILEEAGEPGAEAVEIDDATPFSTPCASPMYFTPSASPAHEAVIVWSTGQETKAGSVLLN